MEPFFVRRGFDVRERGRALVWLVNKVYARVAVRASLTFDAFKIHFKFTSSRGLSLYCLNGKIEMGKRRSHDPKGDNYDGGVSGDLVLGQAAEMVHPGRDDWTVSCLTQVHVLRLLSVSDSSKPRGKWHIECQWQRLYASLWYELWHNG